MLENIHAAELTIIGKLSISENSVEVDGFAGNAQTSCRDVAALAVAWGLRRLSDEVMAVMREPGGGTTRIGESTCEWRVDDPEETSVAELEYYTACSHFVRFRIYGGETRGLVKLPKFCPMCGNPVERV
jgi:hypothetical protein